uniref:RNA1 polyprotein n=1 Tax=Squamellaria imberbis fabavirus TaxID=3115800 RepID=A0AAT9JAT8_9SECO
MASTLHFKLNNVLTQNDVLDYVLSTPVFRKRMEDLRMREVPDKTMAEHCRLFVLDFCTEMFGCLFNEHMEHIYDRILTHKRKIKRHPFLYYLIAGTRMIRCRKEIAKVHAYMQDYNFSHEFLHTPTYLTKDMLVFSSVGESVDELHWFFENLTYYRFDKETLRVWAELTIAESLVLAWHTQTDYKCNNNTYENCIKLGRTYNITNVAELKQASEELFDLKDLCYDTQKMVLDIFRDQIMAESQAEESFEIEMEKDFAHFVEDACLQDFAKRNTIVGVKMIKGSGKKTHTLKAQMGVLSKIKNFASSASTLAFSYAKQGCEFFCENFWRTLRETFEKVFSNWLSKINSMFSWFKNIFTTFSTWCDLVIQNSLPWLIVIKETIVMALGLICASALVYLLERVLLSMGLISNPLNLVGVFIGLSVATLTGLAAANIISGAKIGPAILLETITSGFNGILKVIFGTTDVPLEDGNVENSQIAEGQMSPSGVIEHMAHVLTTFNARTLQETGRSFGAISSIKNGIIALKDMLMYCGTTLYNMTDELFGLKSCLLADVSVIMGLDVQKWLKDCDAIVDYMHTMASVPSDVLERLKRLLMVGRDIRHKMMATHKRVSPHVVSTVQRALEKVDALYNSAILVGSSLPRKTPFFLEFVGKPGVGKSTTMQKCIGDWLKFKELPSDDVYTRATADQYWSNYKRQSVCQYDDLGAVMREIPDEAELINIVSCAPYPLNMADLKEKGKYFDSKLIVATSNFTGVNPSCKLGEPDAFLRRRHMLVEVSLKNDVAYDPSDPTANQKYTILRKMSPFMPLLHRVGNKDVAIEFDNYSELFDYIINATENHDKEQTTLLQSTTVHQLTQPEIMSNLIDLLRGLVCEMPTNLVEKAEKEKPGCFPILPYNGTLYVLNGENIEEIELDRDSLEAKQSLGFPLRVALSLEELARSSININPLAVHYASEIIKNNWILKNLAVSSACSDVTIREIIATIPKWQLLYLHILGESHSSQGKGWFSNLFESFREKVQDMYKRDYKLWNPYTKLLTGFFLVSVVGGGIFKLLQSLWECGTGAKFFGAATAMFTTAAQSIQPNRKEVTEYRFRNMPIRRRNWSKGQECFGDKAEWLVDQMMGTLIFGSISMQVAIFPGRRLVAVNHGLSKIPNGMMVLLIKSKQQFNIRWNIEHLKEIADNELAVYQSQSIPEVSASVAQRIIHDPEAELPNKFGALFFSYKKAAFSSEFEPTMANINCTIRKTTVTIEASDYCREIPRCMEYEAQTMNGDCGSMILVEKKGRFYLVGLHVAGRDWTKVCVGNACFIPRFDEDKALGQMIIPSFDPTEFFQEFDELEPLGPNVAKFGIVKEDKRLTLNMKTRLKETPPEWHCDTKATKVPSILTKLDPRLLESSNPDFDPYTSGMTKYEKEAGPFDASILDLVANDILEEWIDASEGFDFTEASMEEALNGIEGLEYFDSLVVSTSEGYPYILDRERGEKGKSRYLEGEPGSLQLATDSKVFADVEKLELECIEKVPHLVGIECPKDEKVSPEKVYVKPKTRLFTVLPMTYNLVVRRKFLKFVRFIMKRRDVLAAQVGTNPYSNDWDMIGHRLLEVGDNILCCDYSRFDGFMPRVIMEVIAKMINKLCGGSERVKKQRVNLLMACCSRFGICRNVVYRVECGIPSGFPLTVIVNSILNEILIRYFYRVCFQNNPLVRESFKDFIRLVVYGDDNLISVHPSIKEKFNGDFLKSTMKMSNITITDGKDKTLPTLNFRNLFDCDFLKRSFKPNGKGGYVAPMELDSLWNQLHYVSTDNLEMRDAFLINADSVLRELFLHSKQKCSEFREKLLKIDWIKSKDLPSVGKVEAFFEEQRYNTTHFNLSVDAMLHTPLVTHFQEAKMPEAERKELLPGYSVCSYAYYKSQYRPDDYPVYIGDLGKVSAAPQGMTIKYQMGSGRGGLPTADWIKQNMLRRNCAIRANIGTANREGKHVVFISGQDNIVSSILLSLVLSSQGVMSIDQMAIVASVVSLHSSKIYPELSKHFDNFLRA